MRNPAAVCRRRSRFLFEAEPPLEYLFGVSHTPNEEKTAFEGFIDWVHARWRADTSMRIYHYAHYEPTALKRLASAHATREAELDQLLRNQVLVDLYNIVRHGLLVGEPGYSLKNLEHLVREDRGGDVQSATDSIVEYDRCRHAGASYQSMVSTPTVFQVTNPTDRFST